MYDHFVLLALTELKQKHSQSQTASEERFGNGDLPVINPTIFGDINDIN